MSSLEVLSKGAVRVIAENLHLSFQRIAAGLPTGAFKRLVQCYEAFAERTISCYDAALQSADSEPDPLDDLAFIDAIFSGALVCVQKDCAELVHPPQIQGFPEELTVSANNWICGFGGYDPKRTSVVLLPKWEYHWEIHAFPNPVKTVQTELEAPIGLPPVAENDQTEDRPDVFLVFKFPQIAARNVLHLPVLLHEFGHAIEREHKLINDVYREVYGGVANIERSDANSLVAWIREFIADLLAIHLGGPCFLLPFQEFSVVANVLDGDSATHPSSRLRLMVMLNYLRTFGYLGEGLPRSNIETTIESWGEISTLETERNKQTNRSLNRQLLLQDNVLENLHKVVRGFCDDRSFPAFNRESFNESVPDLVQRLRAGLPPVPRVNGDDTAQWSPLPAVFNAVWELWLGNESLFNDFDAIPDNSRGAALRSISNLALKGIQAAEHERLWREASHNSRAAMSGSCVSTRSRGGSFSVPTEPQIRDIIDGGSLVFAPLLEPGDQVRDASVNLRLGTHFVVARAADLPSIKPHKLGQSEIRQSQEHVTKMIGEIFVLHPGRIVLAATLEYIAIPSGFAGLVLSRSSFGRLGLIVATATFIHPGWKGCLTLELSNVSEIPIELPCGSPIAQLVLFSAGRQQKGVRRFPLDRNPFPTFPEFSPLSSAPDWKILDVIRGRLEQL
jgi:dCTP deaminase